MSPNDADGMANSVDPDQTAPLGAVWSGSALFAQAHLSENLGSLRYDLNKAPTQCWEAEQLKWLVRALNHLAMGAAIYWFVMTPLNLHSPSGPVHPYQLNESISNFMCVRCIFFICILFRI